MTHQEIKDYVCEQGYESAVLFENPSFDEAFMGISHDGRLIYDYNKMVESLEAEGMTWEEAIEFIDYNTIRSLPYVENSPIILFQYE